MAGQSHFSDQLIRCGSKPLHFMVCRDENDHIVHYFIMCSQQKFELLKNSKAEKLCLTDYGVVVASGFGHQPTRATRRILKQNYGYDYDVLCPPQEDPAQED